MLPEVDYNIVWDVVTIHVPELHRELALALDVRDV